MHKYDFVIIGAGLGGLLCGLILSREGFKVCILEKNLQIGGCLQTFKRNGSIFDTGVHYIGSLDEGQITNRLFRYFGIMDRLKLKRLDTEGFDILDFKDARFQYPIGMKRFVDQFSNQFPKEKKAISRYAGKLEEVIASLDLYNLKTPEAAAGFNSHYTSNAADYISSITDNRILQKGLAGLNILYAGTAEKTSLYLHSVVSHSFISSAWRTIDGSEQIADLLAEEIRSNGGVIRTEHEVSAFEYIGKRISAARLKNGDTIHGKRFISNVHPSATLRMIDEGRITKPYRERIHNLENTISAFTVYVCLKENSFPYENFNYYKINTDSAWGIRDLKDTNWPSGYMFLTPATSKSEIYADCAIIMTFMDFREVDKWKDTETNQRGEEYLAFKQEKAELLLNEVEKSRPGFRNRIKTYYTSTPLTYRDYTGTKDGSIYGISRDCNDPIRSYIPSRTKMPNLFFTGQNISMHGVLGVAIGSILTCSEFLGMEYLVNKINEIEIRGT